MAISTVFGQPNNYTYNYTVLPFVRTQFILVMYVRYNGSTVFSICQALHPVLANWWQQLALLSDRWQLVQQRALWRQWSLQDSTDWPFFVWDPCCAPAFSSWEPPEDIQSETIKILVWNPVCKITRKLYFVSLWGNDKHYFCFIES